MNLRKKFIAVTVLFLVCAGTVAKAEEMTISLGRDIGEASKAMAESGYTETGLDMVASEADTELKMWSVGEGILILVYSSRDRKVVGMSYFLCDERPKSTRKTFDLNVRSFDPETREMVVLLPDQARDATARKQTVPGR